MNKHRQAVLCVCISDINTKDEHEKCMHMMHGPYCFMQIMWLGCLKHTFTIHGLELVLLVINALFNIGLFGSFF